MEFDLAQLRALEQVDRFVQARQQGRNQAAQPHKMAGEEASTLIRETYQRLRHGWCWRR